MPARVCVLTSVHQPFDGRIFHRQCSALARAGYQVTLVAPADFRRQERDGVSIVGLARPGSRLLRPLVWWGLYRIAGRLQPDVVHVHDPELLLIAPLLRLRFGRQLRLIYDVHEYLADSLRDKFWIPRPLRGLAAGAFRRIERTLVGWVDGIVCAVEGQRPLYAHSDSPLAVVRNLPFAALFGNPVPHPALEVDGLRLIYVGLILPKRGISVLLDTLILLKKRGVCDVHLFLIGPSTSPDYLEALHAAAAQHNLSGQFHWLGYVPHDQIKHYLANAHVGLAPGLYTRQYSNPGLTTKIFEYLLCGLPVITADYPHRRAIIEESSCGLAVPAEDAAAHAEAILWLRDNPEDAQAMGRRGCDMVLDHYTWEAEQARLLSFYQQVLQAGQVGSPANGDARVGQGRQVDNG